MEFWELRHLSNGETISKLKSQDSIQVWHQKLMLLTTVYVNAKNLLSLSPYNLSIDSFHSEYYTKGIQYQHYNTAVRIPYLEKHQMQNDSIHAMGLMLIAVPVM